MRGSHTYICGLPLSRYEWVALEIWPENSRWVADFEPNSAIYDFLRSPLSKSNARRDAATGCTKPKPR